MQELTVYRKADALSWLPMKVRVNTGGYESLTTKEPALLKTRTSPYNFQIRLLGMRKRIAVKPAKAKQTEFQVQLGQDGNAAFGVLLALMVALFVLLLGIRAQPTNVLLVVVGLLLVPTVLTVLLGRIAVVPVPPSE